MWINVDRIKGGTTDEAFQERRFLLERGAPVWAFSNFQDLLRVQEPL